MECQIVWWASAFGPVIECTLRLPASLMRPTMGVDTAARAGDGDQLFREVLPEAASPSSLSRSRPVAGRPAEWGGVNRQITC